MPTSLKSLLRTAQVPDGTAELLQKFSRRVMPVRLIQSENSPAAKRNAGAGVARSRVLLFFDDDMHLDGHRVLETFLTELESSNRPLCFRVSYPGDWCRESTYYQFKQAESRPYEREARFDSEPRRFVSMASASGGPVQRWGPLMSPLRRTDVRITHLNLRYEPME